MPIISGGSPVISKASVTLTDAQVKALPTTPVALCAAPGAGRLVVPIGWAIQKSFAAAAYTNVTVAAATRVVCTYDGSTNGTTSCVSVYESGFAFFGAATVEQFPLPAGSTDDGNGGSFPPGGTDLRNLGLFVQAVNTDGNFTGGNAANTLTVVVYFAVV